MPKLQEFTGQIVAKEPLKVYKKNEFYGNINYKLTILKEKDKKKLIIFVYANLISEQIYQAIKESHYFDKKYLFSCTRKKKNLILAN